MWTRLLSPWGRIAYAAVVVMVVAGFSVGAVVTGNPTTRTIGNLVVVGLWVVGLSVAIVVSAAVLRRRNRLIAEKRGGTVFGVVRLDEHTFKVLAARSGATSPMDDGTFALTATPDSVEFWKSAATDLPTISLPRTAVTAVSYAPHSGPLGGGVDLTLDNDTDPVILSVLGWGGILPASDAAVATVIAEFTVPEEPARRWISS